MCLEALRRVHDLRFSDDVDCMIPRGLGVSSIEYRQEDRLECASEGEYRLVDLATNSSGEIDLSWGRCRILWSPIVMLRLSGLIYGILRCRDCNHHWVLANCRSNTFGRYYLLRVGLKGRLLFRESPPTNAGFDLRSWCRHWILCSVVAPVGVSKKREVTFALRFSNAQ